jgi:biotin operon repressor
LVLVLLQDLAENSTIVFVSRAALAHLLGTSDRAVEHALRTLQASGWIVREMSHGGRGRPRGFRVIGAYPRLAGMRAVPAGDEAYLHPTKPVQLSLFDVSSPPKEKRQSQGSGTI